MKAFKMGVAVLATLAGLAVTSDSGFAAGAPASSQTVVRRDASGKTVTYRKVCTPTGCYLVPVTTPAASAPKPQASGKVTYRKVCTPTGCYLVPVAPSPVKNYGTIFEGAPSSSPAPTSGERNDSPFYSNETVETLPSSSEPEKPSTIKPVSNSKPVTSKPSGPRPSPFYP